MAELFIVLAVLLGLVLLAAAVPVAWVLFTTIPAKRIDEARLRWLQRPLPETPWHYHSFTVYDLPLPHTAANALRSYMDDRITAEELEQELDELWLGPAAPDAAPFLASPPSREHERAQALVATLARMLRDGQVEDVIGGWTLDEADWRLLANKSGATRLGFALLLKFFELEGRFRSLTRG